MRCQVIANAHYIIGSIDDRLYGAFLEHLGRAIYSGIYEPDHPCADSQGFRRDVLALVKELAPPVVRYPGGNFVSAYDWEDGIGPREKRPTRLDLAWHTRESNEIGIHEFADWCQQADTDMMLAVNLGSRGIDAARNFLEYVNHPGGSYWSDKRIENGRYEPWNVKLWCLGNEMDGPWQIGQKSADEYGKLAHETAKAMRAYDSSLELVVCGSSNPEMPTYPQWEATVLDHCYESVDYISLHMYFSNYENNIGDYLAISQQLDRYIASVAGVIDFIKAKKRSNKTVAICFDEWNVWYHSRNQDRDILEGSEWPFAPSLLEDIYNFEDALLIGCVLNTFIRRSDRVRIACIAQLVNVIAPIMTEKGGSVWRQTIFYPYYYASYYGRGIALDLVNNSPCYDTAQARDVPYLDIAGVHSPDEHTITLFAINRHPHDTLDLQLSLQSFGNGKLIKHRIIAGHGLKETNTAEAPNRVAPRSGDSLLLENNMLSGKLPALSYHLIRIALN